MKKPCVAVINGSLGGDTGNTGSLLQVLLRELTPACEIVELTLAKRFEIEEVEKTLEKSQGFVFATGTYWDSWGSPMQRFFEETTRLEASAAWLGKPAAVLVTMHSVGGKAVLSRLQGVLNTLGVFTPPMSGLVYSLANHLALKGEDSEFNSDFWSVPDVQVIAHNLIEAMGERRSWRPWAVDSGDPYRKWFS